MDLLSLCWACKKSCQVIKTGELGTAVEFYCHCYCRHKYIGWSHPHSFRLQLGSLASVLLFTELPGCQEVQWTEAQMQGSLLGREYNQVTASFGFVGALNSSVGSVVCIVRTTGQQHVTFVNQHIPMKVSATPDTGCILGCWKQM